MERLETQGYWCHFNFATLEKEKEDFLHQLKRSALSVPVGAFLEGSRKKTVAR